MVISIENPQLDIIWSFSMQNWQFYLKMVLFDRKTVWYQYMVKNYHYTDVIKLDYYVLFEKVLLW